MEKVELLNEAFSSFRLASKSLETSYGKLSEKVQFLTQELAKKNKQLESAVLEVGESKDYLQAVLQSISEAIIVLDQDERISIINRAAKDLFALGCDDAVGMFFPDLECSIEHSDAGSRLSVKGMRYDIILSRSTVRGPEGAVRGYVLLIKDVTRLKELERQHERNARLIAMGEMAATIVHEIRSPLCSIDLFSSMLLKDLEGTRHAEMASGISTGIKSLNNILTNMLFFARPHRPSFRNISLNTTVEESLNMLLPLLEARGIRVAKTLVNESVKGDGELLKQVLINILMNGAQSMPDGGNLDISMTSNNETVTVLISDEGEGINPDCFEKIFDPFFSTKEKGTGLGLTIAHRIMQSHHGFIEARKNNGRGSSFSLHFPKGDNIHTKKGVEKAHA